MSDQIRATGYRTVPVTEEVINPELLERLSSTWHYGWEWSGPEPTCDCPKAPCGLIVKKVWTCELHEQAKYGAARQLHRASACPSA